MRQLLKKIKLSGQGLEKKTVFSITFLIIFVAVTLSTLFVWQHRSYVYNDLKQHGFSLVEDLVANSSHGVLTADRETLSILINQVASQEDVAYVIIQDSQGKVLAATDSGLEKLVVRGAVNQRALTAVGPLAQACRPKWGEAVYDIAAPVLSGVGQKDRIGTARIGISLKAGLAVISRMTITTVFITLLIVLAAAGLTLRGVRKIVNPVQELVDRIQQVAGGDLTQTVATDLGGEIGELAKGFNVLTQNMSHVVSQIRAAADKVSFSAQGMSASTQQMQGSTAEISTNIQQMARGVATQAARIEETSQIMNRMAEAIRQIATSAQQTSSVSEQTINRAQSGGAATEQAVETMDRITNVVATSADSVRVLGQRSQQIGEITEVITKIADQTNLLALNAAIEAARAGDAGRGFAVVAEEVRKLAEGSTEATTKIGSLIMGIQGETSKAVSSIEVGIKEVSGGRRVVDKAGGALSEIIEAAERTARMIVDISTATQQQLRGVEQAVEAMNEVAVIAHQGSSAAELASSSSQEQTASMQEMAASAQELSDMAEALKQLVDKFKLTSQQPS